MGSDIFVKKIYTEQWEEKNVFLSVCECVVKKYGKSRPLNIGTKTKRKIYGDNYGSSTAYKGILCNTNCSAFFFYEE